jgi:hypothetical protein
VPGAETTQAPLDAVVDRDPAPVHRSCRSSSACRGDPVDGTRRRCGAPPQPSHRGRLARWSRHDMAPMSPSAPDSGTPRPQLTASDVSPTDSVSIRPVLAAERGGRITT